MTYLENSLNSFLHYLSLSFSFWLQLIGLSIVITSLWMLTDPTFMLSMTQSYNHYHIALYVFLAIGILITLGAFFGCMGVCRESQCLLVSVSKDTPSLPLSTPLPLPETSCIFRSPHMSEAYAACLYSIPTQSEVLRPLFFVEFALTHSFIYSFIKLCTLFFTVLLCHSHRDGGTNCSWSLGFPQQR